ncbi:MAG TPA: hypothetical protein VHV30_10915 [Polyangiaceae bacterium]|jgi:hypothetical protein|nr:hypothetical protein [Polyangiaceae bacterium]
MGRVWLAVTAGVLTGAALLSTGCVEVAAPVPDPANVVPPRDALLGEPFDVQAIAEQVAAFRGLPLKAAVPVQTVDDGATRHHVVAVDELPPPTGPDAFWQAIAVPAPPLSPAPPPVSPALFARGLARVFEQKRAVVWTRRVGETNDGERVYDLVHAIVHVLQQQNGVLPSSGLDDDRALARRALLEGDADLTASAFLASRRSAGDHWLAHAMAEVGQRGAALDAFAGAPPYVRRQWFFPYADGFVFVGSVYRTGGFALVDQMLQHPPTSTSEVLHPDRYINGLAPARVDTPKTPEGFTAVAAGPVGEVRLHAWLDQCPTAAGAGAVHGWQGDSLVVAQDAAGRSTLLWSTVWDDAGAAEIFEGQLQRTRAGWFGPDAPPTRTAPSCTNLKSGPDATIVRDGTRVVYVKGMDAAPATLEAKALLAAPVTRPPASVPLGAVQLGQSDDPLAMVGHGERRGDWYVNPYLGLSLPTAGFHVYEPAPGEEVAIGEEFGTSTLEIRIFALMTRPTPDLVQRVSIDIVGGFEGTHRSIYFVGETPLVTRAGPGVSRRWYGRSGTDEMIIFVPVCDNRITIVAHARGDGPGLWPEAKRALRGMQFDVGSRACKAVADDVLPPAPARP